MATSREIGTSAGGAEAGRIRQVEHLRAEIEALRLGHTEVLNERHIQLDELIASQDVSSSVSVCEVCGQQEAVGLVRQERLAGRVGRREIPTA